MSNSYFVSNSLQKCVAGSASYLNFIQKLSQPQPSKTQSFLEREDKVLQ